MEDNKRALSVKAKSADQDFNAEKKELEESKVNPLSNPIIENIPPKLLAWCSYRNNKISIMDLETKQEYASFDGVQIKEGGWGHVKEIPNTNLLVSLNHHHMTSANMEIFNISKKRQLNKIYSLGEVNGISGWGDLTYNSRRNVLGTISIAKKISYHLFNIDANASNSGAIAKLNRKSKWHPHYSTKDDNHINGLDFNPAGESVATIDRYGVCLISDINTNYYSLHLDLGKEDYKSRCRWITSIGEPLLFVKYDVNKLNIFDVEMKALTLTNPVKLENGTGKYDKYDYTNWIDVCPIDGNLLATGGSDSNIKIFDKRGSKIVKTFDRIHSRVVHCVRWSSHGKMITSASDDATVKLLDFKTGNVIHTGKNSDGERIAKMMNKRALPIKSI